MKLLKKENINEAAKLLLDGAVVAFATATVYGLAVIYDNKDAQG